MMRPRGFSYPAVVRLPFFRKSNPHITFKRTYLRPNLDPVDLAKSLQRKVFIGGKFEETSQTFEVRNPATGELVANVGRGNKNDIDRAVKAAKEAQRSWGALSVKQRGALVAQCSVLLKDYSEELARLITLETGKAIRTESRVETSLVADIFNFYGGLSAEIKGETIPWNTTSLTYTTREPVGVVGVITPWNVPLMLMSLKLAPALVCGNGVVVKPAEEAPLAALRLSQILSQVLPSGLLNLVPGFGPDCGEPLVNHEDVGKVSFTGSVEVGKRIYRSSADKLMPVTLELGGKSPMIVLKDASLQKAVDGAIQSMRFTRQGQSCTAASRIYVHEDLFDSFVQKMSEKVNLLKIGDPFSDDTDIGAVISKSQLDKINHYVNLGKTTQGVNTIECCSLPSDPKLKNGFFTRPVLFTNVPEKHDIVEHEIFGPVAAIIKWRDFDHVIDMANNSKFGLASSVWTNDLQLALKAVKRLQSGIVQVNQNQVVQPNLPVGGWKESGMGREGSLDDMLESFTKTKTVSINFA